MFSQSNLFDRMLRHRSYQPFPHNFSTNIQYKPQDGMLRIFADDTDLFFSHSDINILFEKMSKELANVSNWFNANKLSLNVEKTKFSFFDKSSKKDNIPLRLPNLNINGFTIEGESSIKFLGAWKMKI